MEGPPGLEMSLYVILVAPFLSEEVLSFLFVHEDAYVCKYFFHAQANDKEKIGE